MKTFIKDPASHINTLN